MMRYANRQAFNHALSGLSVSDQRRIGAAFIQHVLDLTDEPRFRDALAVLAKADPSAAELADTYNAIHSIYVSTHPRSDLLPLDYTRQAEHFIAEACLVCSAPVYAEASVHHIAQKAAMYCCMARTCAGIEHDGLTPSLERSQQSLGEEMLAQHRLLEALAQ